MLGLGQVYRTTVGAEAKRGLDRGLSRSEALRRVIESQEIDNVVGTSEVVVGQNKFRIARDGIVEQSGSLDQIFSSARGKRDGIDQIAGAQVQIVGRQVMSGALFDRCFFLRRESGPQLRNYLLSDLGLNTKNVGQFTVVMFGP